MMLLLRQERQGMRAQEQEQIKQKLQVVQRWCASGQKTAQWAHAHGVDGRLLMGWISYERRWRARLAGQAHEPDKKMVAAKSVSPNFVAVGFEPTPDVAVRSAPSGAIRIECPSAGVVLHWPLGHSQDLAALLQALRAHDPR